MIGALLAEVVAALAAGTSAEGPAAHRNPQGLRRAGLGTGFPGVGTGFRRGDGPRRPRSRHHLGLDRLPVRWRQPEPRRERQERTFGIGPHLQRRIRHQTPPPGTSNAEPFTRAVATAYRARASYSTPRASTSHAVRTLRVIMLGESRSQIARPFSDSHSGDTISAAGGTGSASLIRSLRSPCKIRSEVGFRAGPRFP